MAAKGFNNLRYGGLFLADGNIDTLHAIAFLVDNRINRDCCFTGLTVTDDQLALSAADWHHRINGFKTGLHRFMHRFTVDNARCIVFYRTEFSCCNRAFAVQRLTQRVHYAAEHSFTHGNLHNLPCTFYLIAFTNLCVLTQDNNTDVAFFQVERHAHYSVGELQQFPCHRVFQTVDTGDTVADLNDGADFGHFDIGFILLNLTFDQTADLFRSNAQYPHPYLLCLSLKDFSRRVSLPDRLPS
ncbi:hypothetical protein D3C87_1477660 [compost metagenome]